MIRCRTWELNAFRLGHALRLAAWGIGQGSDTEARRAVDRGSVGNCERVREQEQEEDQLIYLRSQAKGAMHPQAAITSRPPIMITANLSIVFDGITNSITTLRFA